MLPPDAAVWPAVASRSGALGASPAPQPGVNQPKTRDIIQVRLLGCFSPDPAGVDHRQSGVGRWRSAQREQTCTPGCGAARGVRACDSLWHACWKRAAGC